VGHDAVRYFHSRGVSQPGVKRRAKYRFAATAVNGRETRQGNENAIRDRSRCGSAGLVLREEVRVGLRLCLQRLYEQDEERYWETIRSRAKVVYDRDDIRTASYGVYYTPEKPLTKAARAKK